MPAIVALVGRSPGSIARTIRSFTPGEEFEVIDIRTFYAENAARTLGIDFDEVEEQTVTSFRTLLALTFGDAESFQAIRRKIRVAVHVGRSVLLFGINPELDLPHIAALGGVVVETVIPKTSTGMASYQVSADRSGKLIHGGSRKMLAGAVRVMMADITSRTFSDDVTGTE